MADLIKCPACGSSVARNAIACSQCGREDPGKWSARRAGVPHLTLALVLAVAGLVLIAVSSGMAGSGPGPFGMPPLDDSADRAKAAVNFLGIAALVVAAGTFLVGLIRRGKGE